MEPADIPDDRRVAVLLVKFMKGKIKGKEERELDRWIASSDDHYTLFEKLTSPSPETEAFVTGWFNRNGISSRTLKKLNARPSVYHQWLHDSSSEKMVFIAGMIVGFLGLLLAYLVVKFL